MRIERTLLPYKKSKKAWTKIIRSLCTVLGKYCGVTSSFDSNLFLYSILLRFAVRQQLLTARSIEYGRSSKSVQNKHFFSFVRIRWFGSPPPNVLSKHYIHMTIFTHLCKLLSTTETRTRNNYSAEYVTTDVKRNCCGST